MSSQALIQEQSTPPTGSPPMNRETPGDAEAPTNPSSGSPSHEYDDTTPLNPNHNLDADVKAMEAMLPKMEEGEAGKKDRKSRKKETGWVQYARVILPHVGMVALCVLYAVAGATVFYVIERPQEHRVRNHNLYTLRRTREQILRELWELTLDPSMTKNQFRQAAFEKSDAFIKALFESLDEGGYMSPAAMNDLISVSTILDRGPEVNVAGETMPRNQTTLPDMWSFIGALFFATATLTTVGYGQIAPVTTEGRLVCVGFGLLGIPLTLMTIADIGKFLGEGLKRVYRLWDGFRKSVVRCILRCFRRSRSYELQTQDEDAQNGNSPETKNGNTKESEAKEKSPEAEATSKDEKSKEKDAENENGDKTTTEAKAAEELAADVATSIPVEWIFVLIVAYTFVGAGLFKLTEPWSLLEAFYFCFITMTTIGYGDFVPLNQKFFALSLLYIVLGLAITTMSIDQAGSEYIKKVHYFGRKIQSAKQALSNVRNMISYANWVKRRYGLTDQQIRAMAHVPDFYGVDWFLRSGAFVPNCYRRLYFIDQRTESMLEEIFTITTESDQDLEPEGVAATNETEFGSRRGTTGGSLAGQSFSSQQYRDGGGAWLRVRKRLMEQRRARGGSNASPTIDINCCSLRQTPTTPFGHTQPSWSEMSHLERIAALQRVRSTARMSGRGARARATFTRAQSGHLLLERSKTSMNNNDHSPKAASSSGDMRATINRQLTSVTLNHYDGAVGSLISL